MSFILVMQGWFNVHVLVNITQLHYTNKPKEITWPQKCSYQRSTCLYDRRPGEIRNRYNISQNHKGYVQQRYKQHFAMGEFKHFS